MRDTGSSGLLRRKFRAKRLTRLSIGLQNANVLPRSFDLRLVEGMERTRGGRLCREVSQGKIDEEWIPIDDLVREIANKKRAETSKERFKRRSNHDGSKLFPQEML